MYIPKRYGQSREDTCAFCDKKGLMKSKQGLIVCNVHKDAVLPDIKCVCGSYLDLKQGKFGPFFTCMNCGCINLKKGLDILNNQQNKTKITKVEIRKDPYVSDPGKYPGFDYGIE